MTDCTTVQYKYGVQYSTPFVHLFSVTHNPSKNNPSENPNPKLKTNPWENNLKKPEKNFTNLQLQPNQIIRLTVGLPSMACCQQCP